MPSEAFKEARTLKLPPGVRAPPQVYGRDTIPEPVFATPGKYVIRVGENLEGDYNPKSDACNLTVAGAPK